MRKLLIFALVVAVGFTAGLAGSNRGQGPTANEPSGAPGEMLVADANGNVLKCNGKAVKVRVNELPAISPEQVSPTMMDREKGYTYGCKKDKAGRETGEATLVEAP